MSKIDEIRKRLETPWDSPAAPSQYQILVDAKALLAALDGEWQSKRPEAGSWWLSLHPIQRVSPTSVYAVVLFNGDVFEDDGSFFAEGVDRHLTGALWQRRTVPGDPFKGGGE